MSNLDGKTIKLEDQLLLIAVEESGTILDIERRCYYDLNDTAFFLARQLEKSCQQKVLTAKLVSEFEVSEGTARSDVDAFINELKRRDLIVFAEEKEESINIPSSRSGLKSYQSPALECQKELTVASGSEPLTPPSVP